MLLVCQCLFFLYNRFTTLVQTLMMKRTGGVWRPRTNRNSELSTYFCDESKPSLRKCAFFFFFLPKSLRTILLFDGLNDFLISSFVCLYCMFTLINISKGDWGSSCWSEANSQSSPVISFSVEVLHYCTVMVACWVHDPWNLPQGNKTFVLGTKQKSPSSLSLSFLFKP